MRKRILGSTLLPSEAADGHEWLKLQDVYKRQVPSQVLTEDARLLRFLTPTEAWKGHVASRVSLPGEWPLMLVEIFHREDGQISMTCALGVPKSSLKAGDCFLLPRGLPFQLATNPSLEPVHYTIAVSYTHLNPKLPHSPRRCPSRHHSRPARA